MQYTASESLLYSKRLLLYCLDFSQFYQFNNCIFKAKDMLTYFNAWAILLLIFSSRNAESRKPPEPLLLTPYIQQGSVTAARFFSLVVDKDGVVPTSYSGFITVDQTLKNHLFFWLFPALNSDPKAPLLIWLNGGPGESSMIGLLLENGPLKLGKSKSGENIYLRRNNSWVNKFSILYIDNPVGVGYSYSESGNNGYRTTQDGYTKDFYEFIKQFYKMFPEFIQRDLYIGGQSYAGKYVPAFAYKIHQEIHAGRSTISLKGIFLGGPLIDAKVQFLQSFDLYYNLGYITNAEMNELKQNFIAKIPQFENHELSDISSLMYQFTNDNFFTFERNHDEEINAVMAIENLRLLLHVGNLSYADFNADVYSSISRDDLLVSSASKLSALMDNYKVLIYTGDLDGIISSPEIENVLQSLPWSSQEAYNNSRRQPWIGANDTVKGFFTRVSKFCRVVIRGAGHRTGFDQPENTLEMMNNFVINGCLS